MDPEQQNKDFIGFIYILYILYIYIYINKESKFYYSTHFPEFVVIYVYVLLCKSKVFLSIVAMIVMIKQFDNCFSDISKLRC